MFLDEELEQIYKQNGNSVAPLFDAMCKRLPKSNNVSNFLNILKQIDGSWKLFCKRHSYFYPDTFREFVLNRDIDGKFKKALNW